MSYYDPAKGRYKIVPGIEYGKKHHNEIAHVLAENFPDCEVFMSHPYDYGHSVDFVVELKGKPVLTVSIQVVRHDLDGV